MSADLEDAPPPTGAPKGDPRDFVFRGRPRPVVRFRRGIIVGGAGTCCAALAILAWMSLEPPSLARAAADDQAEPSNGPAPEMLAGAPATYDKVPRLGPPLPGDLGPPIVAQERASAAVPSSGALAGEAAIAAERQRSEAERRSALASGVLTTIEGAQAEERLDAPAAAPAASPAAAPDHGARGDEPGVPSSPWLLSAGTVIAASLVTALNSDTPGAVVAQVTRDVRDATGRVVLVPRGSRLLGSYRSSVGHAQKRLTVAWDRLVFPTGASVSLGGMPATDARGDAGIEDKVNFHEGSLLKAVVLSAILGASGGAGMGGEPAAIGRALGGAERQTQQSGATIVSRALEAQPTIEVRAGWPVRALVTEDLHLMPWTSNAD